MTDDLTRRRLIRRVRALRQLAEHPATPPAEADSARQVADRLSAESGLTADDFRPVPAPAPVPPAPRPRPAPPVAWTAWTTTTSGPNPVNGVHLGSRMRIRINGAEFEVLFP